MRNSELNNMIQINSPKYLAPFDQQATNRVLKQLELQVMDVQAIIAKLKNSLGINKNASASIMLTSPRNMSQVDLNMSSEGGQSTVHVELTYSETPGSKSRAISEYVETNRVHRSPPKNILKKLVYDEADSIIEEAKEQTKINTSYQEFGPSIIKTQNKQTHYQTFQLTNIPPSPNRKSSSQMDIVRKQYEYGDQRMVINTINVNDCNHQIYEEQNEESESVTRKITDFEHHFPMKNQHYQETKIEASKKQISLGASSAPDGENLNNKTNVNKKKEGVENLGKWNTQSRIDRLKAEKQRFRRYCEAMNYPYSIKTKIEPINENTCAKNELENILVMNYHSKKSQQKPNAAENKEKSEGKNNQKMNNFQSPKKQNRSALFQMGKKLKSPVRSPFKSTNKSANLSPLKTIQKQKTITHSPITVKSKPPYIQKFINKIKTEKSINKDPKSRSESPIPQNNSQHKYSHPRKSPNKIKCSAVELQEHRKSTCQGLNRQKFVQKMLEQCYVRRFLTQAELCKIYQQFCHHKVPRYQWEQKVIEKIFKKIHQFDQII